MKERIHLIMVGFKRFLLRVLRMGRLGFKLFGLPHKRIMVSQTQSFFERRIYTAYSFRRYCTEEVALEQPIVLNDNEYHAPVSYTYEHFIMVVPHGRYYHKHPSVITQQGYQLAIVSNHSELTQNEHVLFQELFIPRKRDFTGLGLVLSTANDLNYYHCLFQIPAKIWLLERVGIDWSGIDLFFLERSSGEFQDEIITSLGIEKFRLIDLGKYPHVSCERLMALPSFWKPEPWLCRKLVDTFLPQEDAHATGPHRLFISRSQARYRRILEEEKLMRRLKQSGFQLVLLEGLSIGEQAQLFHQAQVVISAHGAALANLVFCRPETKVLELRVAGHDADLSGVYEHLSSICQLKHFTYLCEGKTNDYGTHPKFMDLLVDQVIVEEFIKEEVEHPNMVQ